MEELFSRLYAARFALYTRRRHEIAGDPAIAAQHAVFCMRAEVNNLVRSGSVNAAIDYLTAEVEDLEALAAAKS